MSFPVPPRTLSFAAVLRKATDQENTLLGTVYMPPKAASRMAFNARFPFMRLLSELRKPILEMSAPDYIDLADFSFRPGIDPAFVPALAQQGSPELRLECIEGVLRKSVLEVTSENATINFRAWLASTDFAPLQGDNKNGFDVVRALGLSDRNRVNDELKAYYATDPDVWYHKRTDVAPSSWADDVELTRLCKSLHSVEMKVALPGYLYRRLCVGQTMEQAIQGHSADSDEKLPIHRLLRLEGLEVLRLKFFTTFWNSTLLKVNQERLIICWLQEEFEKRGQSVKVVPEFGWWE